MKKFNSQKRKILNILLKAICYISSIFSMLFLLLFSLLSVVAVEKHFIADLLLLLNNETHNLISYFFSDKSVKQLLKGSVYFYPILST